jgi:hypothetical protein
MLLLRVIVLRPIKCRLLRWPTLALRMQPVEMRLLMQIRNWPTLAMLLLLLSWRRRQQTRVRPTLAVLLLSL